MNKYGRWLGTLNKVFYKSKLNQSCFWHDLQPVAKLLQQICQLSLMRQAYEMSSNFGIRCWGCHFANAYLCAWLKNGDRAMESFIHKNRSRVKLEEYIGVCRTGVTTNSLSHLRVSLSFCGVPNRIATPQQRHEITTNINRDKGLNIVEVIFPGCSSFHRIAAYCSLVALWLK